MPYLLVSIFYQKIYFDFIFIIHFPPFLILQYGKILGRLDERKRRKDFILDRNLLYSDPFEKSLSPEELEICQRYKVFMRFHSKEEHMELLKNIIEEHRLVKRIQDLQVLNSTAYSWWCQHALLDIAVSFSSV